MKNLIKKSLLMLALMLSATVCVQAQFLSTGEFSFNLDGITPAVLGQTGKDHIFTRNTYDDAQNGTTYDNLVSFKTGEIQVVDFWLDDDQIYTNAEIQALTPVPCFSDGSQLYNEITYNGCEFNPYLPMQMQLVKYQFPGENRAVKYQAGDRLPWDATLDWNEVDTKVIEGIEYRVYKVLIRTLEKNACHFSGNEEAYENNGNKPLKKDDAPLFRLAIQNNNQSQSQGRLADMIIANQEFSIREALMNFVDEYGNIDVNRVRFLFGAGGNNQTQRFLKYNRVTLYGSAGINEPILPRPFEVDGICYEGINRYEVFVSSRLGDDAYHDNVSIPETVSYQGKTYNVKAVGASAFLYCTGLTGVSIPSSVTAIGDCAFMGCSGLSSVTCMAFTPPTITSSNVFDSSTCSNALLSVPGGSKSVYQSANGWSAFAHIQEFASNFELNGIFYNITGDNTVEVTFRNMQFNSYSGDVEIPDSVTFNGVTYNVTAIGEIAFMNCSNLTSVTIPKSVTTIGLGAFGFCENLQFVALPNVTTIGNMAFRGCTSLEAVWMGESMTDIGQSAFDGCPAITTVLCFAYTPPTMGNSSVFSDAVYSNATLYVRRPMVSSYRSADWWKNFSSIHDWDYDMEVDGIYYCKTSDSTVELTYDYYLPDYGPQTPYTGDVSIPDTITYTYSGETFQVTSIGERAFSTCPDLTSVSIPETVTRIGQMAFLGCTGLTSVTCLATTPPTIADINAFDNATYSNATLYVPSSSLNAYRTAYGWKNFTHIVGIGGDVMLGDLDHNGVLDVVDVTAMIAMALGSGTPDLSVADLNFDGQVDVTDVTALISHVLNGTIPSPRLPNDGVNYEPVNGIGIKNVWIQDRAHTPEIWTSQPYCNLYARTAVIHDDYIYIARSNANTVIHGVDTLYQSVIYVVNANDGSLVRELPLTLDGSIYGNTVLNCNAIGVDNFGHLYMAPYSGEFAEVLPVYMVNKNTGELTLIEELDKSDMPKRIDVIDVMGDITRQNAECNIMAAGANSKYVYRWHANRGGDFEAGFNGEPYREIKNFYPATVSHWGNGPVVKMAQVQENDYSGSLFYLDAFYTCPILYDMTGRMVDNFANVNPDCCPMDVGGNGVCEFTLDGRTFLVYVAAQYFGYGGTSGQNEACQVYISELGANRSFSGMQRCWMVPDALGTISDGGTRLQSINVEYGTDEFGNEEVTLFIFKCDNGMAVYKIGPNVH